MKVSNIPPVGPLLPGEERQTVRSMAPLLAQTVADAMHELMFDAGVIVRDCKLTPAQDTLLREAIGHVAHAAGLLALLQRD